MTPPTQGENAQTELAHELFAAAQLAPGEGIEDAVSRIAAALTAAPADIKNLRKALQFYADGHHFVMHDETSWDTVSGEPVNFYEDEAGTATVENGSIAKLALAGHPIKFEDEDAPAQPVAPQGVAYAELPEPDATTVGLGAVWNRHSMRDFADRTHALRASHGQAPAGALQRLADAQEQLGAEFEKVLYDNLPELYAEADSTPTAQAAPAAFQRALDIRVAQGWKLGGDKVPVLYTDSINGEQVCRDDLWLCTTAALAAEAPSAGAVAGPTATREFTNELGNAIRITVEGPNSMHENIVTPMEAEQLRSALNEHAMRAADTTWCAYVAGMICTYLKEDAEGDKATAIAGIIERRLMFLGPSTAPMGRDTLYLLRRLLSNQFTFTASEFRAELEKIVNEAHTQADSITKERLKELLGKPETVHLNMLHGHIAVITMEQCAHLHGEEMQRKWAAADSVLEDAAQVEIDLFNDLNRTCGNTLTAYAKELCRLGYRKTDAARKQGAKHD